MTNTDMPDTAKYFHWNKTALRDECVKLSKELHDTRPVPDEVVGAFRKLIKLDKAAENIFAFSPDAVIDAHNKKWRKAIKEADQALSQLTAQEEK